MITEPPTSFLSNTTQNHSATMLDLFNKATEVNIAVAFLRKSGLDLLRAKIEERLENNAKITIYCGLSFFQTEPVALRSMYQWHQKYPKFKLNIIEYDPKKTFHPKVYCFQSDRHVQLVVGSANFTKGGFETNDEVSLCLSAEAESSVHQESKNYFKSLDQFCVNENGIEQAITEYEKKRKTEKPKLDRSKKSAKKELNEITTYTNQHHAQIKYMFMLYEHMPKYFIREYQSRLSRYRSARKMLQNIPTNMANIDFSAWFQDITNLMFSSGLDRHKSEITAQKKEVLSFFRYLVKNASKKDIVISGFKQLEKINGMGINMMSEVLNTMNPREVPVINNRSVGALLHFGFSIKKSAQQYNEVDFNKVTSIAQSIRKDFQCEDLGRIDHFLHFTYIMLKEIEEEQQQFDGTVPDGVKIFLKPLGYTDHPFPSDQKIVDDIVRYDFNKGTRLDRVQSDDYIILYGTGVKRILGVLKAKSVMWEESEPEIHPGNRIWHKSMLGSNLTPKFGDQWYTQNLNPIFLSKQYMLKYPKGLITNKGRTLGALQWGRDYLELDGTFGRHVIKMIYNIERKL